MIVTILGGLPGSHKESLCQTLTALTKEDSRWAVLSQPVSGVAEFSPQQIQSQLAAMWNNNCRRKPGVSSKKMRVLLVSPGYEA